MYAYSHTHTCAYTEYISIRVLTYEYVRIDIYADRYIHTRTLADMYI